MRPTCHRCRLPASACLCGWLQPTTNRLPLLVLQHPQEARQAKGSARLLQLSLLHCTVQVGEVFDPARLADWLDPAGSSLLLYPDGPSPATATAALPAAAAGAAPAQRLVLLDGTWRQARALLRHNPALQALPRWAMPSPAPSRYAIRRAHRPAQRSTLEAACAALAALEGRPAHYAPLLQAFSGWVSSLQARAAAGPAAGS